MKNVVILAIITIFMGCQSTERPKKPDNLISKDKMADVIYDVFLLNSAKGINKKILEENGVIPETYVYKKHQIDSLQFALSNDYYSYDIKTYEGIIETVTKRLELEKAKYVEIEEKEQKITDSLAKLKKQRVFDSINKGKKQFKEDSIPKMVAPKN